MPALSLADAEFLLANLDQLESLGSLRRLVDLARLEPALERGRWVQRITEGLGFLAADGSRPSPARRFRAAVGLARLRRAMPPRLASFQGRSIETVATGDHVAGDHHDVLEIELDLSGARGLLDHLDPDAVSAGATAVARLPAFVAMLGHRGRRILTREGLLRYLDHARRRDPLHNLYKWIHPGSFFNFGGVALQLGSYRSLVDALDRQRSQIVRQINARLFPFLPPDTRCEVTVHLLFGRYADGWAAPDGRIGIDLEYFADDYERLISITAHEVYHRVQSLLDPPSKISIPAGERAAFRILRILHQEGTANLAAPVIPEIGEAARVREGLRILRQALSLLVEEGEGEAAERLVRESLAGVGPLYSAAWWMAKTIDAAWGRRALLGTLSSGAEAFFNLYSEAIDSGDPHEPRYDSGIGLGSAIGELVRKLEGPRPLRRSR